MSHLLSNATNWFRNQLGSSSGAGGNPGSHRSVSSGSTTAFPSAASHGPYRTASDHSLDQSANDKFVNEDIDVNGMKLKVLKRIGEGGFSKVYLARSKEKTAIRKELAVKRFLAGTQERADMIEKENRLWNRTQCEYIVKYIAFARVDNHVAGSEEFLLISEYCNMGSLSQYIPGTHLSTSQTLQILSHQAAALNYLHSLSPCIVHRDIKLENFLLTDNGQRVVLKLCDFGSAVDKEIIPDREWKATYRALVEDEFTNATTPAYRPPELLNTYDGKVLGRPADMWALGCCLYQQAYNKPHPFLDAGKLSITNGNYRLPETHTVVAETIQALLKVDPATRMTSDELVTCLKFQLNIDAEQISIDIRPFEKPPVAEKPSVVASAFSPMTERSPRVQLTSRLSILTSLTVLKSTSQRMVITNIRMSMAWLTKELPQICQSHLSLQYPHHTLVLHSSVFGRTVVAAASLFAHYQLINSSEHFLRFLNLIANNSVQIGVSPSSLRYLGYIFDSSDSTNACVMKLKSVEVRLGRLRGAVHRASIDVEILVNGMKECSRSHMEHVDHLYVFDTDVIDDVSIMLRFSNKQSETVGIAEFQFNTRHIPVTESEMLIPADEFDCTGGVKVAIHEVFVEFMFTCTKVRPRASRQISNCPPHLVRDDRELKELDRQLNICREDPSRFFIDPSDSQGSCLKKNDFSNGSGTQNWRGLNTQPNFVDMEGTRPNNNNEMRQQSIGQEDWNFGIRTRQRAATEMPYSSYIVDSTFSESNIRTDYSSTGRHDRIRDPALEYSSTGRHDRIRDPALEYSSTGRHDRTRDPALEYSSTGRHDRTHDPALEYSSTGRHDRIRDPALEYSSTGRHDRTRDPALEYSSTERHDRTRDPAQPSDHNIDLLQDALITSSRTSHTRLIDLEFPDVFQYYDTGSKPDVHAMLDDPSNRVQNNTDLLSDIHSVPVIATGETLDELLSWRDANKAATPRTPFTTAIDQEKSQQSNKDPLYNLFDAKGSLFHSAKPTLCEMRRQKAERETQQPQHLRNFQFWKHTGQQKISLLLATLHQILPLAITGWSSPSQVSLQSPDGVKKAYRKAILLVHPDKVFVDSGQYTVEDTHLIGLIFMELNDAWSKYQATL